MVTEQQPVRVVVEMVDRRHQNDGGSEAAAVFAVMLILGLIIVYWYVVLGVIALALLSVAIRHGQAADTTTTTKPAKPAAKAKEARAAAKPQSSAPRGSGPFDPWLNAVSIELADLGLVERSRRRLTDVGGNPVDTDITLRDERLELTVYLLKDATTVSHAILGLKASPTTRQALRNGTTMIGTAGRILYVAHGRDCIVDEFRLEDLVSVIRTIRPSPPPSAATSQPTGDAMELLRRLADLHASGVLSDTEFQSKKRDLLQRI
jgi:hypothetical protein